MNLETDADRRSNAIHGLQEMVRKIQKNGSLVDELIAERRKEAEREQ